MPFDWVQSAGFGGIPNGKHGMTRNRCIIALGVCAGLLAGSEAMADSAYRARAFGDRGRPQGARRTVDIVMGDNTYNVQRIQVRAGETVRFRVKNEGELLHEFNIGTAEMHAAHQREMQMMAEHGMITATGLNPQMAGMDHSRMDHGSAAMSHDDPNSVLVEPGKTGEMVFKFTRAATLEFACNLPGHYQAGMVGNAVFGC